MKSTVDFPLLFIIAIISHKPFHREVLRTLHRTSRSSSQPFCQLLSQNMSCQGEEAAIMQVHSVCDLISGHFIPDSMTN